MWPYYRVLNPKEELLNAVNFPNLSVCSVEYAKQYGSATFKNMVTPTMPHAEGIVEKAIMIDKTTPYTQKIWSELNKYELMGVKELGLDVKKLMSTEASRDEARIDENLVRTLLEAFRK